MSQNAFEPNRRWRIGGLIGMLAGLWGIVITVIFTVSQLQMNPPGTPAYVVIQSEGLGFLYLTFHLLAFVLVAVVAFSAVIGRPHKSIWPKLFILVFIVLAGLSLIPGSTVGVFILPGAVGILASGLLLR